MEFECMLYMTISEEGETVKTRIGSLSYVTILAEEKRELRSPVRLHHE